MTEQITKADIVASLQSARDRWEGALAEVGEERLTAPSVVGDWSVKDVIAHLTFFERWLAGYLRSALRGEPPQSDPETGHMTEDEQNDWIFRQFRDLSLEEVRAQSRQVHSELLQAVNALPEEVLLRPHAARPSGDPLWETIPGNSYEHREEHLELLRDWLDDA